MGLSPSGLLPILGDHPRPLLMCTIPARLVLKMSRTNTRSDNPSAFTSMSAVLLPPGITESTPVDWGMLTSAVSKLSNEFLNSATNGSVCPDEYPMLFPSQTADGLVVVWPPLVPAPVYETDQLSRSRRPSPSMSPKMSESPENNTAVDSGSSGFKVGPLNLKSTAGEPKL